MLSNMDDYLVNRVFQPAVDLLQKQPAWIARQSVVFYVLCLAGIAVQVNWAWYACIALVLFPPAMFFYTFRSDLFQMIGRSSSIAGLRPVFTIELAIVWIVFFIKPAIFFVALSLTAHLCYLFLAACDPPRPPKRKEKLAVAGGGA